MSLTFVIPTYNAEEYLIGCLMSIRNQSVPSDILIVDGGSTDKTLTIAKHYKCKILHNPLKLAEYGVKLGILSTTTDLVVVFAADNELPYTYWVNMVENCMSISNLDALWGKIGPKDKQPRICHYFALIQNDPLCWFLNKNIKKYAPDKAWTIFRVNPLRPLIWGANGLVYRTSSIKRIWDREGYLGDNDAFQYMIEKGKNKVAYYNNTFVYHHHCKSIKHCLSKWQRNHTKHYQDHKAERNMRWIINRWFWFRVVLWVLYVLFLSFPHSVFLAIIQRNRAWLYHAPLSFAQLFVYLKTNI